MAGSKLASYYKFPERAFSALFFNIGHLVAGHPWKFITISTVLFIVTALGMFRIQTEKPEDVFEIYFPKGKPSTEGAKKLKKDFSSHSRDKYYPYQDPGDILSINALFLPHQPKNKNDKHKSSRNKSKEEEFKYLLQDAYTVCNLTETFVANINGKKVTFEDVCAKRVEMGEELCLWPSFCDALKMNSSKVCETERLYMDSSLPENETKLAINDTECGENVKRIEYLGALRLIWYFRKDGTSNRRLSEDWIRQAFDHLFERKQDFETEVQLFSLVVQFDEYHSIPKNDSPYVGITVLMMTLFSVLVSLKFPDVGRSRSVVAVAGVVTTCLAIGSTLGLLAFLRIPFIEVAFLTPFIMLGIGIDSTFVLMFTWAKTAQGPDEGEEEDSRSSAVTGGGGGGRGGGRDGAARDEDGSRSVWRVTWKKIPVIQNGLNANESSTPVTNENHAGPTTTSSQLPPPRPLVQSEERRSARYCVGVTLKKAMISIFISSVTSFLAFFVGSFTPYEAVNITCYHLAVFIVFLLVYETTFFTACLALHHNRVLDETGRPLTRSQTGLHQHLEETPPREPSSASTSASASGGGSPFNLLERGVRRWLPRVVLSIWVRVTALLTVGAFLVISTLQVIHMEEYFNEIEYQPDNSRILQYYYTSQDYFRDPIVVHFVINQRLQYWNDTHMQPVRELYNNLKKSKYAFDEFNDQVQPWFTFADWSLRSANSEQEFENSMNFFMSAYEDFPMTNDIIRNDEGVITKSRFLIGLKSIEEKNIPKTRHVMKELRELVADCPVNIYFSSHSLMFWERNSSMRVSTWISILIALLCCVGVTLLLLPHPVVFLSVTFCAAATMVSTLGFMALYGIEYSLATYIIVLLMIGLCIDYISHTGHAYLAEKCPGLTSMEITKRALENIGVPLFNAAMSSIISISMLGFSSSIIMRRLFYSMVLLFGFSFFYGVIFLPIILSFIGPTIEDPKKKNKSSRTSSINVRSHIMSMGSRLIGSKNGRKLKCKSKEDVIQEIMLPSNSLGRDSMQTSPNDDTASRVPIEIDDSINTDCVTDA